MTIVAGVNEGKAVKWDKDFLAWRLIQFMCGLKVGFSSMITPNTLFLVLE